MTEMLSCVGSLQSGVWSLERRRRGLRIECWWRNRWKTQLGKQRQIRENGILKYILGKQAVRKKTGTGSCSIGGFGTTGVEIQASEVTFLPAFMRTGKSSWICSSKYWQFLILNRWQSVCVSYSLKIPYILESNPHPFYSFRRLKNQIRIRIACGLDSRSWAGFWKNDRAAVRAVRTIQYYFIYYL